MNNVNNQEAGKAVADSITASRSKDVQAAGARRAGGKSAPDTSEQKAVAEAPRAQEQRVEQAVARLNDYVQSLQRDLRFAVDAESGRSVVTVIDRGSQEVIRQIPSETALTLARNLKDFAEQADVDSNALNVGSVGSSLGLINTRI